MDERNYGSFEAGQRLAAKGIVFAPVRGSAIYCESFKSYGFINYGPLTASAPGAFEVTLDFDPCQFRYLYPHEFIVLPSMAEVWRELLGILSVNKRWYELRLIKVDDITQVGYWWLTECLIEFQNRINPADALIDLLIWVEQRKEEKSYD